MRCRWTLSLNARARIAKATPAEGFNLFVWHCHRHPAEAHDVDDPWDLESTYALRYRDANEQIAGKERQFYVCPTVLPVADQVMEWQKRFN
jgi:hypothetical protein